ncbi:PREDICTED: uncharacterized protein LOC104712360 isoform X1 [Camelina sativa]|uniref:Uncharacterized protein LOC104712360 isoform X1 n=1 Tax=Camelina sativa TaxID=90675 RepID=A0ABM0TK25_CAMSA|nr:PREDICTED: uncharacterized protein LOC104712360 isoform X1 [Camelina sativa]
MSTANEQQFPMDQLVETSDESRKKPRISYTRKFLLSLSEKDVCKKLPNLPGEFDEALLLDFEDPSPERVRISGDFSSHGFRRNDYSSSPPTRGELGSNSRGIHGRWEGRSGGWNDKDSDSQSDRDSGELGRRSGMPSRRPWQAPEHDGLLGKGSFPKPSGFGAGTSGPRPQSNDSHQLSRTNEPYYPPRPYKAPPFIRRDTRDSLNDETFGSSDSTSEDRAEEEKKRRASFELLRKEHQKAFQERQKSNPDLRKNDFDFTELLGESKDEKGRPTPSRGDEVNNTPTIPGSNNTSFSSQSSAPRPLVPPGFASTILERKQGEKTQIETSQHERSPLNSKGINVVNGTSVNNGEKPSGIKIVSSEMLIEGEDGRVSSTDASERAVSISSFLGISTDTVHKEKSFEKLSFISTPAETQGYPKKSEQATVTLDNKKSLEISEGPSILDKIFNTAINLNTGDSSNITEKKVEKVEETRSPQIAKSSKFAHLFLEEDNKPVEDLPSSGPPRGLLSLLQGADKLQTFDTKAKGELSTDFPFQGHSTKSTDQLSKPVTAVPPVLTCEDLEQSILSEVSDSYHPPPPPVDQDLSVSSVKKTKQRKTSVDDQASQHLLSLLQRGADPNSQEMQLLSVTERRPPPSSVKSTTAGEADPGKSLTLENLFGSAFMNELQSIGEPVSGRGLVSDAPGVPLRSERSVGELSQRNQIRPDGLPGGILALPEDGNLLAVGGHANPQKYMSFPGSQNQEPEVAFNISDKLAALNSGPRNERPTMGGQDGPFLHQHSQQYATDTSSHLNGSGPVFHPFDSRHAHVKPQLDFMGPGSIIAQYHDPPPNHRFPPNMIHRPPFHHTTTSGHPEFDRLPPHMMQKMHMQDNLQHQHLMQGFPGGGPQHLHSPHVNNQMPGLIPELNPSQGFPFPHRQPNYGMPPPGTQVNRGEHPASLQALLGIQQRIDPSKQIPTVGQAGGPNRQGSMGHELDLGFGYR